MIRTFLNVNFKRRFWICSLKVSVQLVYNIMTRGRSLGTCSLTQPYIPQLVPTVELKPEKK